MLCLQREKRTRTAASLPQCLLLPWGQGEGTDGYPEPTVSQSVNGKVTHPESFQYGTAQTEDNLNKQTRDPLKHGIRKMCIRKLAATMCCLISDKKFH